MTATGALRRPVLLFASGAAIVVVSCLAVLRSRAFAGNPDVLAWGITFDLTLTIPLLYYVTVIRAGTARLLTIVPVFAVCATVAAIVLPRAHQQTLRDLRFIVAPFEIITIALLVRGIAAVRHRTTEHDPVTRIEAAARHLFGPGRLAAFVTSEAAIVWYALFGWNRRADAPADSRSFTVHRRSGWGSVVACIVVLIASESIGLHLLLQLWSSRVAWTITAIDLYGLIWLLGDYNALRLRPSLVAGGVLRIRHGLRWSVTVKREQISAVRAAAGESDWKRRGVLKVAMVDDPRYMIELREPVVAHGLVGMRRTIQAIAISPDDDDVIADLEALIT